MASRSNIFCFLGQFSSVVELFIDFLTSGLSFVKNCWGRILWCLGGLFCFVFICQVIWGIFEIFVLQANLTFLFGGFLWSELGKYC